MGNVIAPLPGVFYRRPGPGKDPFVEVGDTVEAAQTIGIVEIMKQFTEIQSDTAGVIESFEAEDGAMVQPGDTLVVVRDAQS